METPELKIDIKLVANIPLRTQLKSAAMELLYHADQTPADKYGETISFIIAADKVSEPRGIE